MPSDLSQLPPNGPEQRAAEKRRGVQLFIFFMALLIGAAGLYVFLHGRYRSSGTIFPESEARAQALAAIREVTAMLKETAELEPLPDDVRAVIGTAVGPHLVVTVTVSPSPSTLPAASVTEETSPAATETSVSGQIPTRLAAGITATAPAAIETAASGAGSGEPISGTMTVPAGATAMPTSQSPTPSITTTMEARPTATQTTPVDQDFAQLTQELANLLREDAQERARSRIKDLIPGLEASLARLPSIDTSATISPTIAAIKDEIVRDEFDPSELRILFTQLEDEVTREGDPYFWSVGLLRWLELFFWALFGTLLYLLKQIYRYYPDDAVPRYREFTPWYFVAAVRGPILALLVMFFITSVDAGISGIQVQLGQARIELLMFLAGVLGYYSRVAHEQLDILVERVFKSAWQAADRPPGPWLAVRPSSVSLELGGTQQFAVVPDQDVVWKLQTEGVGTLSEGGLYTAPSAEEMTKAVPPVTITATRATDPTKTAKATIVLYKLVVTPENVEVVFGQTQNFRVEPVIAVVWSIDPQLGSIDEKGVYKAPSKDNPEVARLGTEIEVKASERDNPASYATARITLRE